MFRAGGRSPESDQEPAFSIYQGRGDNYSRQDQETSDWYSVNYVGAPSATWALGGFQYNGFINIEADWQSTTSFRILRQA